MSGTAVTEVLRGGRVLVAIAARALAAYAEDVTVSQLRVLVLVGGRGPLRAADLAAELDTDSSSATRLIDRLVRKRLLDRRRDELDRRVVLLSLAPEGERLLEAMNRHRRAGIGRLLARLDDDAREHLRLGLEALADAAAEAPEVDEPDQVWALGWQADVPGSRRRGTAT
ncbi:DNA-binding MarR family transcriptional regulator [Motilibacter peucedani]|uniref:DNA-binding MarR family transcriptional regulator n=1 Tax=Motilibacter peucedani TaxID=598650 RepID=A0A420XV31_9ACTN|nr:MarR family transcriptional regulator [Motilibacter peucedani]RKS80694.1 DNA-binding MarR family transcriptional regulator [Motilibacter peucedani]